MNAGKLIIFAPNLVCCCVDDDRFGSISGRVYMSNVKEPFLFIDIVQMILRMERYFDEIGFPMAATASRSFLERRRSSYSKGGGNRMHDRSILDHKGNKATFVIQVQYRQNATWQGKIVWADQNKTQFFRSALEMINLIDGALGGESTVPLQFEENAVERTAGMEVS